MPGVKLFRREDQDFSYAPGSTTGSYCISAFVNAGNSATMGGGLGVFAAGTDAEWTVTYDELLFIHAGHFQLGIGSEVYHAGPGDTLWIPADTALRYIADEEVWFFFAVYPCGESPSASVPRVYADAPPRPASQPR